MHIYYTNILVNVPYTVSKNGSLICDVSDELREEMLQAFSQVSLSPSHRMTQVFILHCVYHTKASLHKIGAREPPCCTKYGPNQGDLLLYIYYEDVPNWGYTGTKLSPQSFVSLITLLEILQSPVFWDILKHLTYIHILSLQLLILYLQQVGWVDWGEYQAHLPLMKSWIN